MVLNFKFMFFQTHIFVTLLVNFIEPCFGYGGRKYSKEDILKLREEVRDMFNHAYSGYLKYAYPYDELRPLTCDGVDTWGSYSLTLIDALDTLAVMGNYSEFRRVVDIVTSKANFDANINVSVFETNIRIVGGLLSAHLLSQRAGVVLEPGWPCNGPLLRLAEDVAKRLIAAFDTTTGMPYGTVNLRHGVPPGETSITCTAGVGTFILEFGTLTRLTGDPIYEEVALNALYALYHHRSSIGLYGNHIDVLTGRWTAQDSGIGAGVDSYLEYLVKGALLVQRPELMAIFKEGRAAIDKHLKRNDWYLWVSMHKGQVTLPVFQSLEAYWPGVLSLIGDISDGMKSMHNYHQVWKQYGFTPEFYNIAQGQVGTNRESYPLRPELIESTMYLYRATKDPFLLDVGVDILRSIQHSAKTKCGYATIKDCRDHTLENRMESFFLAETTKYLYLLFDPDNFIHNDGSHGTVHTLPSGRECILDAGGYIFNTEAHPLDPGALMCCSENYHEPKPFSREKARGDKFKSFVKESGVNEEAAENSDNVNLVQSSEDDESLNLPSGLIDTEPIPRRNFQFLDKLQENGAIDIVKVPVPSTEDPTENKLLHGRLSLNMLQMIETIINNNLEKHLYKTAWSHDLLKKLVGVIENAEKMLSKERNEIKNGNIDNSGNTEPSSDIIDSEEFVENQLLSNDIRDENISDQISDDIDQNEKSSLIAENYEYIPESAQHLTNRTHVPPSSENNSLLHDKNNHKEYDTNLFELVIEQQFKTIKEAVLTESELVMFHLEKCIENLKLTKSLVEITNDEELKSKFVTARLKVMLLAHNVKRSVDETKKLLSSEELLESGKVILFKRLIELVIDGKTVKDFMDNYKNYIEIVNGIITMGKEKFEIEEESTKHRDEDSNINESEVNESNESFSSEDPENVFSTNSWKTDDITYQVDDRERVSPVSKVNGGPLFTDKLRINTEEEVESIQNTRSTNETPFNPQALLERIRENPRYYRNVTWSTQYELLTCLPQPYFTRIMLSGEFFSD